MAPRSSPRPSRTSRNALAALNPRVICKPVRSPSQMQKDRHARHISSSWPITRHNKSSRGIERLSGNNECFRLAAIQGLLHLPKFMNWILLHNEDGEFPCHPDIESFASKHEKYMGVCPACAFKTLIRSYWGDEACYHDGTPYQFMGENVDVKRIHTLDNNISGLSGADEQQDAEECQSRLIQACLESVNYKLVLSNTLSSKNPFVNLNLIVRLLTERGSTNTTHCSC
jgi:hypothetical protein